MGRALIADPELLKKARVRGNIRRPCIGCNQRCIERLYHGLAISCLVNVGTQNAQACPHSFDATLSGKPDSCPYLGTQMVVSTHGRHTSSTTQKIFIRALAVAFDAC
jgi:hypothetical protein